MTPAENLARARGWMLRFTESEWPPEVQEACIALVLAAVEAKGEADAAIVDRWLIDKGQPHPIAVNIRAHAADVPEVPS